jgi:hypothetical protein
MASADPKAGIESFFAARGDVIETALASLGTTTARVSEDIRRAAIGDEAPEAPQLTVAERRGCATGTQFEPFPPFRDGGWWANGYQLTNPSVDRLTGNVSVQSSALAGYSNQGAWVRADNMLPFLGTTTATAHVVMNTQTVELMLFFPSYAGAGVGVTIEAFDGGPYGPRIGSCRVGVLEKSIPVGYLFESRSSQFVVAQCSFHAQIPYVVTKVQVDSWAQHFAPWAGFAQTSAQARITGIFHSTCI